ncbi:MAG: radical SAM protein [Lachnospiraceae bacterium]|jgi:pyruvate-formate lyase-activating enzyme|nr:radical SAM protein [Lachnospiraceae bacterium]
MNLTERYSKKLGEKVEQAEVKLDGVLLQLEVTNACNHRCIFCPNMDSTRKRKMMDESLARRVMEECAGFLGEDKKICFHMNGEPFLYKKLPELVKYSKDLGFDYSFVTTNGSLADKELLVRIFDAGLDSIKFSINAGSRETYKEIHGADDFDKAMNALRFSWNYRKESKKGYKIFVSCVGIKNNYGELEEFNRIAEQYCDEIIFYYPCAYAGQKIDKAKELRCDMSGLGIHSFEIKHTAPCAVLWNSINVTCEGYLSLCCSEADNRLIVEDINQKKVKDAWLGEKMADIRQKHLAGEIEDMPCMSCIRETAYDKEKINKDLFALSLMQQ